MDSVPLQRQLDALRATRPNNLGDALVKKVDPIFQPAVIPKDPLKTIDRLIGNSKRAPNDQEL